MSDRYTIPTERYIPPSLRPLAKFLGLDDLSNMNPVSGFMRGRDAMSRGDYMGAAIETAAPVAGLGFAGLMRQPLRAGISSLFGVDVPSADPEDIARQVVKVGTGLPKVDMIEGSPAGIYNQTVTQSAVNLINEPAFGEGFAERLSEVAAENSIAVGDRTFMPMDVYTELADRVNNPDFKVVDPKADARRYRESFNIDAYHGQNDVGSSEGITVFPDGRELGTALEPDFSVPSVADENLGINAFQGTREKFNDGEPTSLGTWFGDDPDIANYFSGGWYDINDGGRADPGAVYPVKLRMRNPAEFETYDDLEDALYGFMSERGESSTGDFVEMLRSGGHDGIKINYSTTDTGRPRSDYVIFEGNQVRSPWAEFDPMKSKSSNLLYGSGGIVSL